MLHVISPREDCRFNGVTSCFFLWWIVGVSFFDLNRSFECFFDFQMQICWLNAQLGVDVSECALVLCFYFCLCKLFCVLMLVCFVNFIECCLSHGIGWVMFDWHLSSFRNARNGCWCVFRICCYCCCCNLHVAHGDLDIPVHWVDCNYYVDVAVWIVMQCLFAESDNALHELYLCHSFLICDLLPSLFNPCSTLPQWRRPWKRLQILLRLQWRRQWSEPSKGWVAQIQSRLIWTRVSISRAGIWRLFLQTSVSPMPKHMFKPCSLLTCDPFASVCVCGVSVSNSFCQQLCMLRS